MNPKAERVGDLLVVTTVVNAPPERVFAAWMEPQQVRAWMGCAQALSVQSTIEARVGGVYRHVLQLAGGGECTVDGEFTELDPPRRLAYRVRAERVEGRPGMPEHTTTVDFLARGRRTEVRVTIVGLAGSPVQGFIAHGWQAGLDKLGEVVGQTTEVMP
jgi:uncharacterized protein YndB with AHSA1/START domain